MSAQLCEIERSRESEMGISCEFSLHEEATVEPASTILLVCSKH